MRVVATVKWADARGGAERSVFDVTTGLQRRGADVTVMYLGGSELLPAYRQAGCEVHKVRDLFLDRQRTTSSLLGLTRATASGVLAHPDLVYLQDYEHLTFGAAVATTTRSALVCHLRLVPPKYFARQYRLAAQRVGRFIAVSDDVRTRFTSEVGLPLERIDVVHNGIDLARFSPGTADDRQDARARLGLTAEDYAILFVGRIDRVKGIEVLIEAANRLATKRGNIRLLLVGQPIWTESEEDGVRYVEDLRKLATDVRVEFLGPHLDPLPFYRAADVVVVPSIWREPFGRVVIEAMACGRPVAASRTGGIAEILTGELSEFLVTPGDPDELAALLGRIYQGADEELGARLRAEAEARFGFDRVLDGISASIDKAQTWKRQR
jgi:glycosyltransferase involved in cell wall biosynthesis